MKHLILLLLPGLLTLAIVPARAQDASPSASAIVSADQDAAKPKRQQSAETRKQIRLTRLRNQVGLSTDQEPKAKAVVDKYVDDLDAAKSDPAATTASKRAKEKTLKTEYENSINAILTPAQHDKWAEAKATQLAKLHRRSAAVSIPEKSATEQETQN